MGRDPLVQLAVSDVLVHYAHLLDTGEPARVADEVFTARCDVDYGFGRWTDATQVAAWLASFLADYSGTVHAISNVRADVEGARAVASSVIQAWHWHRDDDPSAPAAFVVVGTYLDELVHDHTGWRVRRRRFRPGGPRGIGRGTLPSAWG